MERKSTLTGLSGLLNNDNVRRMRVDGAWRYSVLDVLALLAEMNQPETLWSDLKSRDASLARLVEYREFQHPDGAAELLEVLTAEGVFRVAQAVDSPWAQRVRTWLASAARQHLEELENPELAILRARDEYQRKGRDRRWIDKRLRGVSARQELTSEWARRGATDSDEYRALTNELMQASFGMDVNTYRQSKHLTGTTANLRDHMSDVELLLTTLAESAATTLHRRHNSQGLEALVRDVRRAGAVTAQARAALLDDAIPLARGNAATTESRTRLRARRPGVTADKGSGPRAQPDAPMQSDRYREPAA
jgi:DNA-damage-inducible protein D